MKTALPAGLTLIADKSPPRAPNAPPIDSNLAEPTGLSIEIFKKSFKLCEFKENEKINNKNEIFLCNI